MVYNKKRLKDLLELSCIKMRKAKNHYLTLLIIFMAFIKMPLKIQNIESPRILWEVPGTPLLEALHSFGAGQTRIHLAPPPNFAIHSAGLESNVVDVHLKEL